jgi:hypothetical protein
MKRLFVLGVLCATAVAAPWTAGAGAQAPDGDVDITGASKTGSHEITVWGTLRCAAASPVQLDVTVNQQSTGGSGAGGDNSHICPQAGDTIKWVVTATGPGPWRINDKVTITALAILLPDEPEPLAFTDTEDHVLGWR